MYRGYRNNERWIGSKKGREKSTERESDLQSITSSTPTDTTVIVRRGDAGAPSPSSITNTTQDSSFMGSQEALYNEVIQKQQNQIRELQAMLATINHDNYQVTGNTRGKNATRSKKKVNMTPQDQINQTNVASFIRETVWSSQKILPKKWQIYRDERNSLCQMILKKVAIPCGVVGRMYWDGMLVAITNDKFCSLRSNFKQELFEQFQG